MDEPTPKPRRFWRSRFGLRTLFVVVVVAACNDLLGQDTNAEQGPSDHLVIHNPSEKPIWISIRLSKSQHRWSAEKRVLSGDEGELQIDVLDRTERFDISIRQSVAGTYWIARSLPLGTYIANYFRKSDCLIAFTPGWWVTEEDGKKSFIDNVVMTYQKTATVTQGRLRLSFLRANTQVISERPAIHVNPPIPNRRLPSPVDTK